MASVSLIPTDDERLFSDSARAFYRQHGGIARLRTARGRQDAPGYATPLWREMADLGWLGVAVPEARGGSGLGITGLALLLAESGRSLAPEPLWAVAGVAADILVASAEVGEATLAALVADGLCAVPALRDLGARHGRIAAPVDTAAVVRDGLLGGHKADVPIGDSADSFIVSARADAEDRASLWLVPADAPGVTARVQHRVDGLPVATVRFTGVRPTCRLADPGATEVLLDRATIALAAEMLGAMREAFDRTLAYLHEREQFGVPIGTFQALRHRAARLFIAIELVTSSVMAAARLADQPAPNPRALGLAASLAKARASETAIAVANEAVQMHGGVGMTEAHDIGLFLKRALVAAASLGDAAWHRDRWATLSGY